MQFFYGIFLSAILLCLATCAQKPKSTKLRLVDLQGKPHHIEMKTPELNVAALAAQGNLSEEKIQAARKTNSAPEAAPVAGNKYASDTYGTSSEAIKNTLQLSTDPERASKISESQTQETVTESDIITTPNSKNAAPRKAPAVEYTLSKQNIALNKTPAVKSAKVGIKNEKPVAKVTKKQKGIFIQTGSFSVLQHAKNSLEQVEKFASAATKFRIEEGQNGDKTVYRVLIGPFASKQKAAETLEEITSSGQQAIIVRNK